MEKLMKAVKAIRIWAVVIALILLVKPAFAENLEGGWLIPGGLLSGQMFAHINGGIESVSVMAALYMADGTGEGLNLQIGKEVNDDNVEVVYFLNTLTWEKVTVYPSSSASTIDEQKEFFASYGLTFDQGIGVLWVRQGAVDGELKCFVFTDFDMSVEYAGWTADGILDIETDVGTMLLWYSTDTDEIMINFTDNMGELSQITDGVVQGGGIIMDYSTDEGWHNYRLVIAKIGLSISISVSGDTGTVSNVPSDIYISLATQDADGNWIIDIGTEYYAYDNASNPFGSGNLAFTIGTDGYISSYGDMYQDAGGVTISDPDPVDPVDPDPDPVDPVDITDDITLSSDKVITIENISSHFLNYVGEIEEGDTVYLLGDFNSWMNDTVLEVNSDAVDIDLVAHGIDTGSQRLMLKLVKADGSEYWLFNLSFSATDQANAWDVSASNGDTVMGVLDGAWTEGTSI